jgi:hypothetical protein
MCSRLDLTITAGVPLVQLHIPSNRETMIAQISRQTIDAHDSLQEAYRKMDGDGDGCLQLEL